MDTGVEAFEASFALPAVSGIVDRRMFLVDRARGRDVVHLGCVDDRLTEARFGTGRLLHEELSRVANSLVGVDISASGLRRLEELVPGSYVEGDVEHLGDLPLPDRCDVVIAAELVEHLGAPAAFLSGLATYLARTGGLAVLTTPNAYSWTHFVRMALRRREWTHPDHRLLYSPTTLARSLELAGLRLTGLRVHAWSDRRGIRGRVLDVADRALLRWNPYLAVGLVADVAAA